MVSEAIHLLVHADAFPDGRRRIVGIDEVVGLDMQFNFVVRNVFRYESEIRDGALISEAFVHNPDYVMGPELTGLFRSAGLDPDRWSGEAAKARGTRAGSEETRA
jgi:hypothetical protein